MNKAGREIWYQKLYLVWGDKPWHINSNFEIVEGLQRSALDNDDDDDEDEEYEPYELNYSYGQQFDDEVEEQELVRWK